MRHDFPNKIIFLDIDGVLNTGRNMFLMFDNESMRNLMNIIDHTGAKIVISSSWRTDIPVMKQKFIEHGCEQEILDNIIGITVRGYNCVIKGSNLPIVRGNEIKHWVDTYLKHPWHSNSDLKKIYSSYKEDGSFKCMVTNDLNIDYTYIILDDDDDILYEQKNNYIQTNPEIGITLTDVQKAIDILNKI